MASQSHQLPRARRAYPDRTDSQMFEHVARIEAVLDLSARNKRGRTLTVAVLFAAAVALGWMLLN